MARMGIAEWMAAGRAIAAGDLVRYNTGGRFAEKAEREIAKRMDIKHVLLTNSGTSALSAALAASGIGPGDEVIVPAYTWMATAAAVVLVGAVPILADIDETLTIDPLDIERKISPYTRAIIPVHMINVPCAMDPIMALAKQHGLLVIEDAAQAVGVAYKGRHLGTIGDAGAFSFNRYKNVNIGEGGALLTQSDKVYARARNYHDLGAAFRGHKETYNEPTFVSGNLRVSEIDGAMLLPQIKKLDATLNRGRAMRKILEAAFAAGNLSQRGVQISPHNDEANAVSFTLLFEDANEAKAFAEQGWVVRLLDSSKHIYTNWDSIMAQRTQHPKLNPWAWAPRRIEYDHGMCSRTLDILARTCRIVLGTEGRAPLPVLKHRARKMLA